MPGRSLLPSYKLWQQASSTAAELLWRTRQNARLDVERRFRDGSYLSRIYSSTSDRRNRRKGIVVRVIDYQLQGVTDAEPMYRLITTILDPKQAPARELAALYHERWEIELVYDEQKTHQNPWRVTKSADLRSQTPTGVLQELYALSIGHFVVRSVMVDYPRIRLAVFRP